MTALYKITNNLKGLQELDIEDCPDMVQAIQDTMEAVEGEFNEKAVSVAHFIMNLDSDVTSIDAEIKRLNERKKAMNNKQDAIKNYLRFNMENTGINKIECPLFSISCVKGRAVVSIDDESEIPDEYMEVKTEIKPKKNDILKAIKSGEDVPGASISQSRSSIRIK